MKIFNKTMKSTKKDFELFKSECEYWIKFFGISEYRFYFSHKKLPEGNYAQNEYDSQNMWVELSLTTEHELDKFSESNIKRTAFHEVCHILHIGFCFLFEQKEPNTRENECFERETESFVRRLENSVFKNHDR